MLNLCSTYMKITKYTKINLRDFRHNLTQLKDSLASGEVFEVTEKGNPLAYFIPSKYSVEITNENEVLTQEGFIQALNSPIGHFDLPKDGNYKNEYRRLLEKKYMKK